VFDLIEDLQGTPPGVVRPYTVAGVVVYVPQTDQRLRRPAPITEVSPYRDGPR
jgi:hypothetical protein